MALTEGEDYYLDNNGLLVFTEKYHLKRGSCCHNGCRHCPYKKANDAVNKADESSSNPAKE